MTSRAAGRGTAAALGAFLSVVGCAGTHRAPLVQVPLLTRAGQVEGGFAARPLSPRSEMAGVVRVAATSYLRLGGSVTGAVRHPEERIGASGSLRLSSALLAEGFVGAEWGGLLFRFGGLLGSGYGFTRLAGRRDCSTGVPDDACTPGEPLRREHRYVRSYGQLHAAVAPPGPLRVALAMRVPFVIDLEEASRESDVSPEFAIVHALVLRNVRLELTNVWSHAQGFALHLGLLLRYTPS